jgi:hypothetical protein
MRTQLTAVVLALACSAAVAGPEEDAKRDRTYKAMSLIDELHLDETASGRLFPALSSYLRDRERISAELATVTDLLGKASDPATVDRLLDRSLAAQRALIAVEATVVVKMRKILPADQAARARILLIQPVAPRPQQPPPEVQPAPPATEPRDPEALFPPKSPLTRRCDPFAQMHRCPI